MLSYDVLKRTLVVKLRASLSYSHWSALLASTVVGSIEHHTGVLIGGWAVL